MRVLLMLWMLLAFFAQNHGYRKVRHGGGFADTFFRATI